MEDAELLEADRVVELINGAGDLIAGGYLDEAAEDLRTALPTARRMFAADPAKARLVVVFALVNLARALRDGDAAEREAALREIDAATTGYTEEEVGRGVPAQLRPYRIRSLRQLANLLLGVGDTQEAVRTATAARDEALLVEPGRSDLDRDVEAAVSEALLASALDRAGRVDEALEASERVVRHEEALASRDPARADLGSARLDHGFRLLEAGRTEEGSTYLRLAVEAYRAQVGERGDEARRPLAVAADRLGVMLARNGAPEQGVEFLREAVAVQRAIQAAGPDDVEALAGGLRNLAVCLSDLDQDDDAVTAAQESLEQFRRLADTDPRWIDEVVAAERLLAEFLAVAGRLEESLELGERSIAEEERRLAGGAARSRMALAETRLRQGLRLARLERPDEKGHLSGAMEIYRQAVTAGPDDALFEDFARTAGRQAASLEGLAELYRGRPEHRERLVEVLEVLEKAHVLDGAEEQAARVRAERLASAQA